MVTVLTFGPRIGSGRGVKQSFVDRFPMSALGSRAVQGTEVRESGIKGAAFGLFATRDWKGGERMAQYEGEVLTQGELDARYGREQRMLRRMPEYVLKVGSLFVDAGDPGAGNFTRFINDARGSSWRNNCKFSNSGYVIVTRRVRAGEEFFVPYGAAYWKEKAFLDERDKSFPEVAAACAEMFPGCGRGKSSTH